jgi:dephospho-CoA kinase
MNIVGLTGISGAGKSTASKIFAERGFHVIDCDKEANRIIISQKCEQEVKREFPEIYDSNGSFCRKIAAKVLFADSQKLERYQKIVFPYVVSGIVKIIEKSPAENVLLDAATLFQSGADDFCDKIIAAVADRQACVERIIKRDGITENDALMRLNNQPNVDFFRKNADYVIENNGDVNEFIEKINACYTLLGNTAHRGDNTSCTEHRV